MAFAKAFKVNDVFKEFNAVGIDDYEIESHGPNITGRLATEDDIYVQKGYWTYNPNVQAVNGNNVVFNVLPGQTITVRPYFDPNHSMDRRIGLYVGPWSPGIQPTWTCDRNGAVYSWANLTGVTQTLFIAGFHSQRGGNVGEWSPAKQVPYPIASIISLGWNADGDGDYNDSTATIQFSQVWIDDPIYKEGHKYGLFQGNLIVSPWATQVRSVATDGLGTLYTLYADGTLYYRRPGEKFQGMSSRATAIAMGQENKLYVLENDGVLSGYVMGKGWSIEATQVRSIATDGLGNVSVVPLVAGA